MDQGRPEGMFCWLVVGGEREFESGWLQAGREGEFPTNDDSAGSRALSSNRIKAMLNFFQASQPRATAR